MTTLSLQSLNPSVDLSIHLQIGQFCTVGASPAADYSVNAKHVEPVHCRIGCRSNSGFIECLADEGQIVVNGKPRNRSRLADGDSLRIGTIDIHVEVSGKQQSKREFEISFSDEPSATTQISGAHRAERNRSDDDDSFDLAQPGDVRHKSSATGDPDNEPVSTAELPKSAVEDSPSADATKQSSSDADSEQKHLKPVQPGKPVFEFDSTDPDQAPLTREDLKNLESLDNLPGQQSLEDLVEPETKSSVDESKKASRPTEKKTEENSEDKPEIRSEPLESGKHWKYAGSDAMAALQKVVTAAPDLNVYTIDAGVFVEVQASEMLALCKARAGAHSFLLSELPAQELATITRRRKWTGRLGHPQAINMFLALSPKRISDEFFKLFDACVLVHDHDLELMRGSEVDEA